MVTVGTHLNADRLLKTRPLIIEICCQLKNSSIMMMLVSEDFTTRLNTTGVTSGAGNIYPSGAP